MKAKEALRFLGGSETAKSYSKELSDKYGISVEIVPHINEEEPADNFLNVVFEYPCGQYMAFEDAKVELCRFFASRGLDISFECVGEAWDGTVMSYRVV